MKKVVGWDSPGVVLKPQHCRLCPLAACGQGFCKDVVPKKPSARVAFLFDMPTRADVREGHPFAGPEGAHWQRLFIEELGYQRSDVLLSTALRCAQNNDRYGQPMYPREPNRRLAEINCRHYDRELLAWNPDLFIITFHPRSIRLIGAHCRQIIRDCEKAFRFAQRGYRPAVLFGEGVAELYYPWLRGAGGLKKWRGHFWFGESPFKDGGTVPRQRLFSEGD